MEIGKCGYGCGVEFDSDTIVFFGKRIAQTKND
jgi:hypothetical protein